MLDREEEIKRPQLVKSSEVQTVEEKYFSSQSFDKIFFPDKSSNQEMQPPQKN